MQDSQNAASGRLDPRESGPTQAEIARAAQEETLRKRKTHAGGGDGVQFHTIFAMVDSSLEGGAESLKKIPKRNVQKDADSDKSSDLPVLAAVETKAQAGEASKEAPKAKTEQEQKPRVSKESDNKKSDAFEKIQSHAAILQARIETQVQRTQAQVERAEVKIERRDTKPVEKPKAQEKNDKRSEVKELPAETAAIRKESAAADRGPAADQGKTQDRRARQKSKEDADPSDDRELRRGAEEQKGRRAEDETARQPKVRERAEEKPATKAGPEDKELKPVLKRTDEGDFSVQRHTEESTQADGGRKKRSISDLEKLTGLHAKAVTEVIPVVAPPVVDIALKSALESAAKGGIGAVDSIKASARAVPGSSNAGSQQHAGGANTQARSSQTQEKLGETARRLASYLGGKAEAAMKAESTFSDMVAKAKLFIDNGRSEMTIQLKPEQLGSLKIKMAVEDGKMEAQFTTDRPEVKKLIEDNADLLKSKLSEVGIEVSAMSVEVRSDAGQASPEDGRSGGLRRVTEFGSGEDSGLLAGSDAQTAYALAGMGTHLSLVA